MLHFLPSLVRGILSILMYFLNSVLTAVQIFPVAIFKLIIPLKGWRQLCSRLLNTIGSNWISLNNLHMGFVNRINWDVKGIENLKSDKWYLVVSNHQSWVDIIVLQKIFNRKIPFLKFFMKKELIWVPILGIACWAMDFPFMRRYSKSYLERHPHRKGKDLEITKKACEKFKAIPLSIMNFLEGTRFNMEKYHAQKSPYTHLLRPRAGGMAFVLAAMGERLHNIIDVTIVYPQGVKGFWAFLCGKISEIKVRVKSLPISKEIIGDYVDDIQFRERFQDWLNSVWQQKDSQIKSMLGSNV